jgi:hypothetical protein
MRASDSGSLQALVGRREIAELGAISPSMAWEGLPLCCTFPGGARYGDGPDDNEKVPRREEWIVSRYEGPGVFPVEVGRGRRHGEEQQPDREDKRIHLPKAPAKLVLGLPIVLARLAFVPQREIDDATFAVEPLLRHRPARVDGGRRGIRHDLVIVANGAHSHS